MERKKITPIRLMTAIFKCTRSRSGYVEFKSLTRRPQSSMALPKCFTFKRAILRQAVDVNIIYKFAIYVSFKQILHVFAHREYAQRMNNPIKLNNE